MLMSLIAHIIACGLIGLVALFYCGPLLGAALGTVAALGSALFRLAARAGLIRVPGRQPR